VTDTRHHALAVINEAAVKARCAPWKPQHGDEMLYMVDGPGDGKVPVYQRPDGSRAVVVGRAEG